MVSTASGSGNDSQVVVTKTKGHFDGITKAYGRNVEELKKLRYVFGASVAPKRPATTAQGGTKKPKSASRRK